jgi:hypothetical protein
VAVGDTWALPFGITTPTPLLILHEVAPDEVQDKVADSGGMIAVVADEVNFVIVTGAGGGGTHAAEQAAWVENCGFDATETQA